jgi:hypothetical protein
MSGIVVFHPNPYWERVVFIYPSGTKGGSWDVILAVDNAREEHIVSNLRGLDDALMHAETYARGIGAPFHPGVPAFGSPRKGGAK